MAAELGKSWKFPVAAPAAREESSLNRATCDTVPSVGDKIGPGVSPELLLGSGTGWKRDEGNNSRVFRMKTNSLPTSNPDNVTSTSTCCPTVNWVRLFGDDRVTTGAAPARGARTARAASIRAGQAAFNMDVSSASGLVMRAGVGDPLRRMSPS